MKNICYAVLAVIGLSTSLKAEYPVIGNNGLDSVGVSVGNGGYEAVAHRFKTGNKTVNLTSGYFGVQTGPVRNTIVAYLFTVYEDNGGVPGQAVGSFHPFNLWTDYTGYFYGNTTQYVWPQEDFVPPENNSIVLKRHTEYWLVVSAVEPQLNSPITWLFATEGNKKPTQINNSGIIYRGSAGKEYNKPWVLGPSNRFPFGEMAIYIYGAVANGPVAPPN